MKIKVKAIQSNPLSECDIWIDQHIDYCPVCHRGINPTVWGTRFNGSPKPKIIQIIYQCPILDCLNNFIGLFKQSLQDNNFYYLIGHFPINPIAKIFSSEIQKISPLFEKIYNQSKNAEEYNLNEIAGGGYRKALEFLIKDYLISECKIDENIIKKKLLGASIKEFVANENIKKCATRAAWLGNDEIHYYKKWEENDIKDLKKLINLTVLWIDQEIQTKQYVDRMPD